MRFNVKGPYSEGFVFAEISNKMDDFVYLMVQDKRTGRVVTLEDILEAAHRHVCSLAVVSPRTDASVVVSTACAAAALRPSPRCWCRLDPSKRSRRRGDADQSETAAIVKR